MTKVEIKNVEEELNKAFDAMIDEEWYPTPAEELETALITLTELGYKAEKLEDIIAVEIGDGLFHLTAVNANLIYVYRPDWGYFVSLFTNIGEHRAFVGIISKWINK